MTSIYNKSSIGGKSSTAPVRWPGWLGLVLCGLVLSGCGLLHIGRSEPKVRVTSVMLGTNGAAVAVTMTALEGKVMRFADEYVATIAQAADDFGTRAGTPEARLTALRWKLGQATSAYIDATGPNAAVNVLDLLVLVTLARTVIQDYGVETFGDSIQPLLETHRALESNTWALASGVLKPEQQQQLRDLIQEWRRKNPHQRYVGPIRFQEFVAALGKTPTKATSGPTSIFSLLYLDPLAGLDPTAAAIEETRRLGERAMYYSQRMPLLLSWQTEVLAYQLAQQPESKELINDATRLASSAEAFAKTAEQLPQVINDQREAAINQVFDRLASEQLKAGEVLTESRQTLNAANEAATSIKTAIKSLDEFVHFVTPTNSSSATADTNSRPFDVLDYGTAAVQVAGAARELNTLLTTMNETTPQLARLSEQATARADHVVNRAFKLGLVLILVLLAGLVLAGLIYLALNKKLTVNGRKS
jgi:hypothetical protein